MAIYLGGGGEMYMKQLAALTEFLAGARRELDEICRHLILNTFQGLNPRSLYIGEIQSNGTICRRASFGFDALQIERWGQIPLNTNIPITEAVNRNKCVVVASHDEFFVTYPAVKSLGEIDTNWSSAIAVPMLPFGAFFLVLHGQPKKDTEFEAFLRSIGHLLIMSLREEVRIERTMGTRREDEQSRPAALTSRQRIIMDLICKGYTNIEISKEIGYSESLIRQESMAIYAFNHVSGRKELIREMDSQSARA